uniref:Calmodulin n=1 Tax=Amphora coffeiformis TaxID=265554 RepID=A0A7S3P4Y0_9STRA|mmetsp:Transcript_882/g.1813  ORF Transcript_882/g.1813 Transcript_882/m.1813 type:complete len:649 (+) Transcript_882:131-2077(+)
MAVNPGRSNSKSYGGSNTKGASTTSSPENNNNHGTTKKMKPKKGGGGPPPTMMAGFAPSLSHPRQRVHARKNRPRPHQGTRRSGAALPTHALSTALHKLEAHVVTTTAGQDALDQVMMALDRLEETLQPPEVLQAKHKLTLFQPTPPELVEPFPDHHLRLFRATYEANDPIEDRSTVVIGEDFLFAGVWDGHGGYQCAEFTQNIVFQNFADAFAESRADIPVSFAKAYFKTNKDYYHFARALNHRDTFFAGTCAVACFIDLTQQKLWCSNLGDSRAVMGTFRDDGTLHTEALSVDHTAASLIERQRIQEAHPHDEEVVLDMTQFYEGSDEDDSYEEPPDWRVKKVAAFTRSIGDLQLKEKNTSALFNSYMPEENQILPRPGAVDKQTNTPTPPYIFSDPETKEFPLQHAGFVIIACDGVWDEMSNQQAVHCVANLLRQHEGSSSTNIAELFIEKVLEKAVERLREEGYEDDLTLEELKRRPKGKATEGSRSRMHDDITVVIVEFGDTDKHCQEDLPFSSSSLQKCKAQTENRKGMRSSRKTPAPFLTIEEILREKEERKEVDKQIVEMMEFFDGMNTRHLEILFNALDVDGNGTLDHDEVYRLINQVMLTDVEPAVVDVAFREMDGDGNGSVDFSEFVAFFGHNKEST